MEVRAKEEMKGYVEGYNACYEQFCKELLARGSGINKAIDKMAIMKTAINSVLLTKEKTNGDVIKDMFPNIELEHIEDIINVYSLCEHSVTFDTDWWNTPYKKEHNAINNALGHSNQIADDIYYLKD